VARLSFAERMACVMAASRKEIVMPKPRRGTKRLALIARRQRLAKDIAAGKASPRMVEREREIKRWRQWWQRARVAEDIAQCTF
jgi:hypothetical protein